MKTKQPANLETFDALQSSDDGIRSFLAAVPTDGVPGFSGYLVPFYSLSDRGTYFVPGSLKKTAKEQVKNAPVLWQHDTYEPIGKHLNAFEDEIGFRVDCAINEDDDTGAEVMSNLRFGVPMGLSIGFDRIAYRSGTAADDKKLNRATASPWFDSYPITELTAITEARWWEGSIVTFAAIGNARPDEVRSALLGAASAQFIDRTGLDALTNALKAGTVPETELALLTELVAAIEQHAAAGSHHGTGFVDEAQLQRRRVELALAKARNAGLLAVSS